MRTPYKGRTSTLALSSSSSTFLGDKPGDKSVDGEEAGLLLVGNVEMPMRQCCGYSSGIMLGIMLWGRCCVWWRSYTFRGIIHLRCAGRKCVGVRDAEASCSGWKSNL